MRRTFVYICTGCLCLGLLGCGEDRLHKTDGGGVTLSVNDFDGLPIEVSVNAAILAGAVQLDTITIDSIVKEPNAVTSDLQTVEMQSYEIIYTRDDGGTRVPPPLVFPIFGSAGPGGQWTFDGLPLITRDQLVAPPLSDLLFVNGGIDRETGSQIIVLTFSMRFFGRTLAGESVDSTPIRFAIRFTP